MTACCCRLRTFREPLCSDCTSHMEAAWPPLYTQHFLSRKSGSKLVYFGDFVVDIVLLMCHHAEQLVLISHPVVIFWSAVTPVEQHTWHRTESLFTLRPSRSSRFFSSCDRRGNKPRPGCSTQSWVQMSNQRLRLMLTDGTTVVDNLEQKIITQSKEKSQSDLGS